jgi:tetratricopeptide (TPR) repeat protein
MSPSLRIPLEAKIMKRFTTLIMVIILLVVANPVATAQDSASCTEEVPFYQAAGVEAYQAGDYETAIANYDCLVRLLPNDGTIYSDRGFFYAQLRNAQAAFADYNRAIELSPEYTVAYRNRAALYNAVGEFALGEADYATAYELQPGELNPYDYVEWGIALHQLSDYEQAIARHTQAIELAPDYERAFYERGFAYIETVDFTAATADFERALEINPDSIWSFVGLGNMYYQQGYVENTLQAYQNYASRVEQPMDYVVERIAELEGLVTVPELDCDPTGSADTYITIGTVALEGDSLGVALARFACAVELEPDNPLGYNARGYVYAEQGAYDLALADYDRAIELDTTNARFYGNRGEAHYRRNEYDAAINDLSRSIELDNNPNNGAYVLLGYAYQAIGEYEASIPYLIQATNTFLGDPDAMANVGYSYYQIGRYEEALLAFEQLAVVIDRDNFNPTIEAITVELEDIVGRTITSSLAACGSMVSGGTSYPAEQFTDRGKEDLNAGDFESAIENFSCTIAFTPFDSVAYNNRAVAYGQHGDAEAALADYAHAIEINPWNDQAYANRGYLYTEQKKYDQALVNFNQALALDSDYANSYYGRAELYIALERYSEAEVDLETVIFLVGEDVPETVTNLLDEVQALEEPVELNSTMVALSHAFTVSYPDDIVSATSSERTPNNVTMASDFGIFQSDGGIQFGEGDILILVDYGDAEAVGGAAGKDVRQVAENYRFNSQRETSGISRLTIDSDEGYYFDELVSTGDLFFRWAFIDVEDGQLATFTLIATTQEEFVDLIPTFLAIMESLEVGAQIESAAPADAVFPETFVRDNDGFTIPYPEGWRVEVGIVGQTEFVLVTQGHQFDLANPPIAGEPSAVVVYGSIQEVTGIPSTMLTPETSAGLVIQSIIDAPDDSIFALELAGFNAALVQSNSSNFDNMFVAVVLGDDFFVAANIFTAPGEDEGFPGTVMDMLVQASLDDR